MSLCPPVKSSLATFKSTVLSGDFQLTPSMEASEDDDESAETKAERELSHKILDECQRDKDRMERSLEDWAWEMLDATMERDKLAEIVLEAITDGIDKGTYGIRALKTKPHWSYRYRVNKAMDVRAIDAWTVDGEWASLDPSHFAWFSWEPTNGDPIGASVGDSIYHAFTMLMQLWPEFYVGNKKFGTPSLALAGGEKSKGMVSPRDAKGQEIPGSKPVTEEFSLAVMAEKVKGGASIGLPYGAKPYVIESSHDGLGINGAIALLEAQIIVCFLLQTRATREAQFGSKADSQSGTDVLTTYCRAKQHALCQMARRPYFAKVKANYNADIARRHTPNFSLGKIDPRNFAAIAQAVGLLYQSGYYTERQLMWLDEYMGMPIRNPSDHRVGPQLDTAGKTPASDPAVLAMLGEIKATLLAAGMPNA